MANAVTTRFLINGSRNFVAVIQITGDGSGDEANTTVIDPANLTGAPSTFKIKSVDWQLTDFRAALKWDATTPVPALALPDYDGRIDFFTDSGIPLTNNAGAGITGKLIIDTFGLGASGRGTIVINGYQ